MRFISLGTSERIGASCHYLDLDGTGIFLDSGSDPEREGAESLPDFGMIREADGWPVDHLIVSHAHHDHMGSVPVLIREYPRIRVHMTSPTRSLIEKLLPNSARLQQRKIREGSSNAHPTFAVDEAEAISHLYEAHDWDTWVPLEGRGARSDVQMRFLDSGHVLGATSVELKYEKNGRPFRVYYSGDVSLTPQTILEGGVVPEPGVDVMIMECTLGADEEAPLMNRADAERDLGIALKRVLDRDGVALIPVFALGRAQEVIALIDRYIGQGLIDPETPIYTAGTMRAIADIYDKTRHITRRVDSGFEVYDVPQRRIPKSATGLRNALDVPGIFVVSSGMLFERTLSNRIAQEIISDARHAILLVGYAVEGSPAATLVEAVEQSKSTVTISKKAGAQDLNCEVEKFRLTGHSHREDLLELVDEVQPRNLLLVHGEPDARMWIANQVESMDNSIRILMPEESKLVELE